MGGKEEVAYCGLCCDECFMRKGEIADHAKELRRLLRQEKFDVVSKGLSRFFKDLEHYDKCYLALGAMVKFRCNKNCREGGGNPFCQIRKCCEKKGLGGCWECEACLECPKFKHIHEIHGDETSKNLKMISKKGMDAFLSRKR